MMLTNWLKAFARDEEGNIAIETVLIIPALFWAYLAMFATFDAYRQYSLNQKAAFVIGDMISRETTPLDNAYVDGTRQMMQFLVGARNVADVSIRVTSIVYKSATDTFEADWSVVRGSASELSSASVKNWHDKLPVMTNNDRITLLETWVEYDPPFDTGLEQRTVRNFVFTKPRYAPQVLFRP